MVGETRPTNATIQYGDAIITDYLAIGQSARNLTFNSHKYGPLGAANLFGTHVKSTASDYLGVIRESAHQGNNVELDFVSQLLGYRHQPATVSTAFSALVRDLGLGENNFGKRELFATAFNNSFNDTSELRNPAVLRAALDAGFKATLDLRDAATLEAARAAGNEILSLNPANPADSAVGEYRALGQDLASLTGNDRLSDRQRDLVFNYMLARHYNDPLLRPAVIAPQIEENRVRTEEFEQRLNPTAPGAQPSFDAWDPAANNGQGGFTNQFRPNF